VFYNYSCSPIIVIYLFYFQLFVSFYLPYQNFSLRWRCTFLLYTGYESCWHPFFAIVCSSRRIHNRNTIFEADTPSTSYWVLMSVYAQYWAGFCRTVSNSDPCRRISWGCRKNRTKEIGNYTSTKKLPTINNWDTNWNILDETGLSRNAFRLLEQEPAYIQGCLVS